MIIQFFIKCIPPKTTVQTNHRIMRRKDGTQFVGSMSNRKSAQVQKELMLLLSEHVPERPLEGPLKLNVQWRYPWRKSEPKKNRANGTRWCDTRPECDNLCKGFQDCMTRLGFWTDDSQVAALYFSKEWCDTPGIYVSVTELRGEWE